MSDEDDTVAEVKSLWQLGLHMAVGHRYLESLRGLGLDPECLFWAEDNVIGHPVLVLVTEQFDRVGPLELSKTLFRAHDHAGTPKEISPFILRLHSPRQSVIRELEAAEVGRIARDTPSLLTVPILDSAQRSGKEAPAPAEVYVSAGGMRFSVDWIYKWSIQPGKLSPMTLSKQWRRFKENIDRLAA